MPKIKNQHRTRACASSLRASSRTTDKTMSKKTPPTIAVVTSDPDPPTSLPIAQPTAEDYTRRNTSLQKTQKKYHKHLKSAKKQGSNIFHVMDPAYLSHIGNEDERNLFTNTCFPLYSDAHNDFSKVGGNLSKTNERKLAVLFELINKHESLFFKVLASPNTHVMSERCTGMLGTYATILRQRAEYLRAEAVFRVYTRMINAYEGSCITYHGGVKEKLPFNALSCLEGLRYRYLLIKMNLLQNLGKVHSVPDHEVGEDMRTLCTHEIKTGRHPGEATDVWTWFLPMHGVVKGGPNARVTLAKLKKVNNKKLAKCFRTACEMMGQVLAAQPGGFKNQSLWDGINPDVQKKRCELCKRSEAFINDFKKCSKCKQARYCSAICQRKHWCVHKQLCVQMKAQRKDKEKEAAELQFPSGKLKG